MHTPTVAATAANINCGMRGLLHIQQSHPPTPPQRTLPGYR